MKQERIEYEFNYHQMMHDLRDAFGKDASLRDLEAKTGVSAATLSRLQQGQEISMGVFLRLCSTMDANPQEYFNRVVWIRQEIEK